MKKTLVALSVLMAATSAQAIELYNQDGATVNMGGDIEVRYKKDKADGSEFKQEIDDSDLNFDIRYAVNDSLSVGGYWEINDLSTKDGKGGDAYVSFISADYGTVKVGKTCTQLDDSGIGSDFAFGISSFINDSEVFCSDEIVRYDLDKGNFYGGFALAQDKNGNTNLNDDSTYFDGKIGYRVADFDFTGFYGSGEVDKTVGATTTKVDEKAWSLQAKFSGVENLELAAAFYNLDVEGETVDTIAVAATYALETVELAAGFSNSKVKDADDFNAWYVNAAYPLAPNTKVYAEVGGDNGETNVGTDAAPEFKDTEVGMVVGIKASF
ncbi:membrane protein [Vibrio sinaloensis]|uniref:porin n=1 Tax=Photobacterium sp. (strain ATCC 43367) TaxID=379097 RepID=UPI00057D5E14|nr:porin [Vibrio sinaloensis]KHT40417.1 membrane protein [Vibrio sinaloensis]KIE19978.1 membrane protein [Vibrio sinaloensis]